MENLCNFVRSFQRITCTKTVKVICLALCTLLLMVLLSLVLLRFDRKGAIVSDSITCASIGKDVLTEGGSAVDAAIAMMLCQGVVAPSSAGLGGGFTAIIYMEGKFDSIVAGPAMPELAAKVENWHASDLKGPNSAGVPGELMGYWEMHKRYGYLPWKRLFQPSIELCKNGAPVSHWMANIIKHSSEQIDKSPTIEQILPYWVRERIVKDSKLKFPLLAKTLEVLAQEGAPAFYHGHLGRKFVADIRQNGGYMTMQDLQAYKVIWDDKPPMMRLLKKFKVFTTPLPTYGAATVLLLNIVRNLLRGEGNEEKSSAKMSLFWHKFVEATKHAFGQSTKLGDAVHDPEYNASIMETYEKMLKTDFAEQLRERIRDDAIFDDPFYYGASRELNFTQGSANVCVLSPSGDAVAATSSLLSHFGAYFASNQTGIILNDMLKSFVNFEMDPYQIVAANRPLPAKQLLLPYSPAIVIDERAVPHFIVSASGGARAVTIVADAIIEYVILKQSVLSAVGNTFLHNQLFPNEVEVNAQVPRHVLNFLESVGHKVVSRMTSFENYTSSVGIGLRSDEPEIEYNLGIGGSKDSIKPSNNYNLVFAFTMFAFELGIVGVILHQVLFKELIPPVVLSSTA